MYLFNQINIQLYKPYSIKTYCPIMAPNEYKGNIGPD